MPFRRPYFWRAVDECLGVESMPEDGDHDINRPAQPIENAHPFSGDQAKLAGHVHRAGTVGANHLDGPALAANQELCGLVNILPVGGRDGDSGHLRLRAGTDRQWQAGAVFELATVAPGLCSVKDQAFTLSVVGAIVNLNQTIVVFGGLELVPKVLINFPVLTSPPFQKALIRAMLEDESSMSRAVGT